jgi:hypothetical protein
MCFQSDLGPEAEAVHGLELELVDTQSDICSHDESDFTESPGSPSLRQPCLHIPKFADGQTPDAAPSPPTAAQQQQARSYKLSPASTTQNASRALFRSGARPPLTHNVSMPGIDEARCQPGARSMPPRADSDTAVLHPQPKEASEETEEQGRAAHTREQSAEEMISSGLVDYLLLIGACMYLC